MTETINGVPLELLKRAVQIPSKASVEENHAATVDRGRAQAGLRDMLSSLPAGMEVISAKRLSERIRPNVEAAPWVCDEVKRLESIIDSLHVGAELRVEAVLSADRTVRHHQAQWIDTLGGLLRDARKYLAPGAVRSRIDAALSGIKEPQ